MFNYVNVLRKLLFQLGEISEAEDALAEANILNNKNADVWAYLSLVCLKVAAARNSTFRYYKLTLCYDI